MSTLASVLNGKGLVCPPGTIKIPSVPPSDPNVYHTPEEDFVFAFIADLVAKYPCYAEDPPDFATFTVE
jgi:hypothetical protein